MVRPNPIYRHILSLEEEAFRKACADIVANLPNKILNAFRTGRIQDGLNRHDPDKRDWLPFRTVNRLVDIALAADIGYITHQELNTEPLAESFLMLYDRITEGRGMPPLPTRGADIVADVVVLDHATGTVAFHRVPETAGNIEEYLYGTLGYDTGGCTWLQADKGGIFHIETDE